MVFGDALTGSIEADTDTVAWRLNFADAVLAYVKVGKGSPAHREVATAVAIEALSADEAVELTAERHGVVIDRSYRPLIRDFDDYLIDGTLMLKNNLRDAQTGEQLADSPRFRAIEVEISRLRLIELSKSPISGDFDSDHYRAVHRALFRDLYPWAGQFRTGPDSAMIRFAPDSVSFEPGDTNAPLVKYSYYSGTEMTDAASVQFAQLAAILRAKDLEPEVLLSRVAESLGEFHSIHPFRDGNSRAFCAFGAQFGQRIGYLPDYSEFAVDSDTVARLVHAQYNYQATDKHDALSQSLLNLTTVAARVQPGVQS
ncbi:Fic family protein [Subtercola endophyticus]|uniref:Fic family protein n=1 Tax=Subtercola endophyticus TaxID=2895559 RepID=UPI001E30FCBE|nr:Fic family protein [Subtercola endophyticus]UFS57985.1 Fic family protein [Subtercola endophyticus]